MCEQKASNKNKLLAINAIGDIALSAPEAIKNKTYQTDILDFMATASKLSYQIAPYAGNDPDNIISYLATFRLTLVEAYVSINYGILVSEDFETFLPYISDLVCFLEKTIILSTDPNE